MEDIIIECLKIYGFDAYYLPRHAVNEDLILGEDTLNKYDSAYPLEMYMQNTSGFEGDGDLMTKFGFKSPMQVPRITKITLNMGVSEAVADKKVMDSAVADLTKIAGQKPVVTKSKKAIAGFKIREGQAIGCMVTLRGVQMYEFLDRFVTVALPRVRDFRGISGRAFDGRGNYNIGVKEQIIFPEIEYDKVDALRGLNISITTTAKTDEECKALLAGFRFPFKN